MSEPHAGPHRLETHPVHLGAGATALPQPRFTGDLAWYTGYAERHAADGVEGRLVAMHTFTESWASWEMHPLGSELVVVTAGRLRLIQEARGERTELDLGPGEYAVNLPGTWHTADVLEGPATALFVTSGLGTEHRSR